MLALAGEIHEKALGPTLFVSCNLFNRYNRGLPGGKLPAIAIFHPNIGVSPFYRLPCIWHFSCGP